MHTHLLPLGVAGRGGREQGGCVGMAFREEVWKKSRQEIKNTHSWRHKWDNKFVISA